MQCTSMVHLPTGKLTLALVVVLAIFAGQLEAVPCPEHEAFWLNSFSQRSSIRVANGTSTLFALDRSGNAITYAYVGISWMGVQELSRPGPKCLEADSFPDIEGDSWGAFVIHRVIEAQHMDCSLREVEEDLGNGLIIKTIETTATHPSFPEFFLAYNVSTPSQTVNITVDYPQTHTVEYVENTFKFAFQIQNWPWASPNVTSYLVAAFDAHFKVPSAFNATSKMEGESIKMDVTTTDGLVAIQQEFDANFYLDGVGYVHRQPRPEFSWNSTQPLEMSRTYSWAFCEYGPPGVHFNVADYDPSLAILVNQPIEPSADPSTPLAKSNKGVLIASIVVPLVCIAAVAGVIVYFAAFKKQTPFASFSRKSGISHTK